MSRYVKQAANIVSGSLEGLTLETEEREFLQEFHPVGLTLFARNIDSDNHNQLIELTGSLQRISPNIPFLIKIDQEGGRVRRIKKGFPDAGPALDAVREIDDQNSAFESVEQYGYAVGKGLAALGVHINFAPVVDVLTNPKNTAIGDRCFGSQVDDVIARAGAFLKGMQSTPILGCLKHFPGQGDANFDTHHGTATIGHSLNVLMHREILPFDRLLSATKMVMVSHCIYPALDIKKPASLSKAIMIDLLRDQLGFDGVIVTDDMTMGAIDQDESAWLQAIIESVASGADLVLVCRGLQKWEAAIRALSKEAELSSFFRQRLNDASQRCLALRSEVKSRLKHRCY